MIPISLQKEVHLNTKDTIILFLLTCTSFIVHFWILYSPDCVVFDEVHFGNFTNWYTKSEFFYDIHPPLGKLIMFLFANLSEYDGNINFERHYGSQYPTPDFLILRITPALFSSCCAPLIYLSVRFSGFSWVGSMVSGFMIIFDTSLITEQRFILSDGMLHFFTCLFFAIFSYTSMLRPFTKKWYCFMHITGTALGAACSCKNTAWGLMALVAIHHIIQTFQIRKRLNYDFLMDVAERGCILAAHTIFIYLLSFYVHFIVLPYTGQGTPYLIDEMKQQLVKPNGASLWASRITSPGLFTRTIWLSINMHHGNMGIKQWHPYQSRPIGWPFLTDIWVAFWTGSEGEVNCMGNVFAYYFAALSILLMPFLFFSKNKRKWLTGMRFTAGWAVSYLPFFLIPRSMYLYHYLIPLMIGCMGTGAFLEITLPKRWRGIFGMVVIGLCLMGFYIWSPYVYGNRRFDRKIVIWNKNWEFGDSVHRALQRAQNN